MPCPVCPVQESQHWEARSLQTPCFKLHGAKVQQIALGWTCFSRALVFSYNQALKFFLEELHQGNRA